MRVIISLTTIPSRVATMLPKMLDSLQKQTVKPYSIEIAFSPVCRQTDIDAVCGYDHVVPIQPERDYGPVTKLHALVSSLGDKPDDLIITVDDDIFYKPMWLETLIEAAEKHPDDAIGFAGWGVGGFLAGSGSYQWPSPPCFVDVVEGWAGAAYRRKFFDGIDILNSPPAFQFVDDVWISSVLNRRGIKRRLIGFPMAQPIDVGIDGLHKRHDFVELNRLAVIAGFGAKLDETGPIDLGGES